MKFQLVIRQLFSNLWRERTPVIATILTISVAITILIALSEVGVFTYSELKRLKKEQIVEIYLQPGLSQSQLRNINEKLNSLPTIESMRFISKEKAADIFKQEFGEDIQRILDENPLPASFEIKMKNEFNHKDYLVLFKSQVEKFPYVDEVHYRHTVLENLENIMQIVVITGLGAFFMLLISMDLLIRNTVKLSVYSRRKQIDIMKILGAGDLFIRLPFILEGLWEGICGGFISAVLLTVIHRLLISAFPLLPFPASVFKFIWLSTIVSGAVFGTFVAAAAAGRFTNNPYYHNS